MERLAALRERVPGCHVVSLVDLSTRMSLASSTKVKFPHEKLDQLCQRAVLALHVGHVSHAMQCHGGDVFVFVRSEAAADEALCIMSAPWNDMQSLIDDAQALLADVSVSEDAHG